LTDLVVEQALRDRLFATRLLGRAGLLAPVDESALAEFEAVVGEVAAVTTGSRARLNRHGTDPEPGAA
jgi:hypothetical protein